MPGQNHYKTIKAFHMTYKRRDFLKMAGMATAGLSLSSVAANALAGDLFSEPNKLTGFGLQLYTLRDVIGNDPKAVLKDVASFGYKQIESYEGKDGMFWGMTNKEFKAYMDELGMKIVSSHCNINQDFERKAAEAAEIGMKYLICPYKGPQKSLDDFKRFADEFNEKGKICKQNGIRFAYHNHDYSFKLQEGQYPQDVMMKNTDADSVDFEMDMYWVITAEQDPIKWIKKYPKRFKLCHVKDRAKGADGQFDSVTLGKGAINYKKIVAQSKALGMQYFIVEQEKYDGTTPIECAKDNATYMKTV